MFTNKKPILRILYELRFNESPEVKKVEVKPNKIILQTKLRRSIEVKKVAMELTDLVMKLVVKLLMTGIEQRHGFRC